MWSRLIFEGGDGYLPKGQGVETPTVSVHFSAYSRGRFSHEPTVIRGFRETRRQNKK